MPKNESKTIFISHAAADGVIADKVVDLLNTGMRIDVEKSVFCTSLEGLKIPPGMDFKQFIKDQIQEPKIVLLLISQNYLASQFCLAEVGASWAMSHLIVPFLIPPVKFDDMKAVLSGIHALKIQDPADWNEALNIFKKVLGIDPNFNRWERKRDEKITEIMVLLPKQPDPPIVPLRKLQEVEARLKEANAEIGMLEENNKRLEALLAKLKDVKDATEVAKIELAALPASEVFDKLLKEATSKLSAFRGQVVEAFYYHFRGEPFTGPRQGMVDTEDKNEELRRAIENGYLSDDLELVKDDPKIRGTLAALSKLKKFIDDHPELAEPYEAEHGHQLDFASRRFWNNNLF